MKIAIVGLGYVGLSMSALLSQKNDVVALDIDEEKVLKVNKRISPINDNLIKDFFATKELNLKATSKASDAYNSAEIIIICTPTNFDEENNYFDTKSIELCASEIIELSKNQPLIVIKSTVPIGFTESLKKDLGYKHIIFSPEFLREGKALEDNLYPSRIIIGGKCKKSKSFANLLASSSRKTSTEIISTNNNEAEAIKLFANSYLALRVAYFNELDTFSKINNLDSSEIIKGVSLDPRIGMFYNNPSFGYGGYCLPKDTKQLLSNFDQIPQNIISAIIKSNETRINFITSDIINMKKKLVGIYKLAMKKGSDNFRSSSILEVANRLKKRNINVLIYEPSINDKKYEDFDIENNIDDFLERSELVIANRIDNEILKHKHKLYTRDIFKQD